MPFLFKDISWIGNEDQGVSFVQLIDRLDEKFPEPHRILNKIDAVRSVLSFKPSMDMEVCSTFWNEINQEKNRKVLEQIRHRGVPKIAQFATHYGNKELYRAYEGSIADTNKKENKMSDNLTRKIEYAVERLSHLFKGDSKLCITVLRTMRVLLERDHSSCRFQNRIESLWSVLANECQQANISKDELAEILQAYRRTNYVEFAIKELNRRYPVAVTDYTRNSLAVKYFEKIFDEKMGWVLNRNKPKSKKKISPAIAATVSVPEVSIPAPTASDGSMGIMGISRIVRSLQGLRPMLSERKKLLKTLEKLELQIDSETKSIPEFQQLSIKDKVELLSLVSE